MLKTLDKSELVTALLLIGLGAYIVGAASQWPYMSSDGPGPAFFPMWSGILIMVFAALQAAIVVVKAAKGSSEKIEWKGAGRVVMGWAGLMVSIAVLQWAGFVVSFLLLCLFLVSGIFGRSFLAALSVGIGASVGFWLLFVLLLEVRLPAGPWGF